MTQPKIFVFGIDGGDFRVAEPLMRAGKLPHLAAFWQQAARAPLTCTYPAHTAPGWASLLSASYPGRHGIFQFFDTQEPAYRARVVGSQDFGCGTALDWLADQGWRAGFINVPMTHPPRHVPGYQITWPLANTLRFCDPPQLLGQLAEAGCHFKSDLACMFRGDMEYISEAVANVQARTRSVQHLIAHEPVDFLMVVMTEVDRVCHHYWHLSDPAHPQFTDAPAHQRHAIEACYVAIDRAFGELCDAMPEDATVVVVSDHGSGIGLHDVSLNVALADLGLFKTREGSSARDTASWFQAEGRTVDWDATRAYCPVPGSFGVNLNLRGRQRHGTVSNADAERVLSDVTAGLRALKHPQTGLPLAQRVLRAEQIYPGPHSQLAPDLLIIPDDERVNLSAHIAGPLHRPSYQTGLHRYEGMWMQRGPSSVRGALAEPMRIVDVLPTLFADAGVSFPASVDGAVRDDVYTHVTARLRGSGYLPDQDGPAIGEDALVTERLRAMGYL